jgi:ABC-type amino acid transport system permease subunit
MDYRLNFFFVWRNFDTLLAGLRVSLEITGLAIVIGLFGGFVVALMRLSGQRLLA